MSNEANDIVVSFNGEIYNYRSLRLNLSSKYRFRTTSDTEVLLRLYEEYGPSCLDKLEGMFAFAVWDERRQILFAARDHVGKKPLYYAHQNGVFCFASEIATLIDSGLVPPIADRDALAYFWRRTYVAGPKTAFRDIFRIPPANALIYKRKDDQVSVFRYGESWASSSFDGTFDDAVAQVRELVQAAVERRLVSDVPISMSLSGGIDSACIAAAVASVKGDPINAITVSGTVIGHSTDESVDANLTAKRCGLKHHIARVEADLASCLDKLILHHGEPFAAGSSVPSYYLFQQIRKFATVALTGDGGDEVFGGYPYYQGRGAWQILGRGFSPRSWRIPWHICRSAYNGVPWLRGPLKGAHILLDGLVQQRKGTTAIGLATEPSSELERIVCPDFRWLLDGGSVAAHYEQLLAATPQCLTPARGMMFRDQNDYLPNHCLVKVDVASMLHSVEARSPLLDVGVVKFVNSLPDHYIFHRGQPKALLREAFRNEIDPRILSRRKTGFGYPLREAFREQEAEYCEDVLMAPNEGFHAMFDRDRVRDLVSRHRKGMPYQTTLILKLLHLKRWMELMGVRVV